MEIVGSCVNLCINKNIKKAYGVFKNRYINIIIEILPQTLNFINTHALYNRRRPGVLVGATRPIFACAHPCSLGECPINQNRVS